MDYELRPKVWCTEPDESGEYRCISKGYEWKITGEWVKVNDSLWTKDSNAVPISEPGVFLCLLVGGLLVALLAKRRLS